MANTNDIIPKQAIDGIVKTDKAITKLDQSTLEFITTIERLGVELKKGGVDFKALNVAQKQNATQTQKLTAIEKEQLAAEKALEKQRQRGLAQMSKLEAKERALQAAIQKEVKSEQDLIAKTNALVAVRRRLDVSTTKGAAEHKRLTAEINKNTIALKQQDKAIGRSQRNVGNYGSALKGVAGNLMGALGLTAGLYGLVRVIGSSLRIITGFEKEMAKVKAITGATKDEFEQLKKSAIDLGAQTLFKASEVANLQKEYAKLGFSTREILAATEATLMLATATESDLAESAVVAGSTLRAFGLNANEMQRVVDVMAKSFTTSALDIEKWKESMKFAAPIAKAAGISVEETAAMLAKLADAGITGSLAGNALKEIFSQLTTSGKPLNEKMAELAKTGLTLADAEDEVGRRAKAALLVLSDQVPEIERLKDEYINAKGAAKEMADIVASTTSASVTLLGSAWDGLILSMGKSTGVLKTIVDKTTEFVSKVQFLVQYGLINPQKEWRKEMEKSNAIQEETNKFTTAYSEQLEKEGATFETYLNTRLAGLNEIKGKLDDRQAGEKAAIETILNNLGIERDAEAAAIDQAKKDAKTKKDLADKETKIKETAAAKKLAARVKGVIEEQKLEEDFLTELEKDQDDFFDWVDKKLEGETSTVEKELDKQLDLKAKAREKEIEAKIKADDDEKKRAEELADLKRQLVDETIESGFSIYQSTLDRESMALQEQREAQLATAGEDKEKQAKINAEFDKKEAAVKTKKAKAEKVQAMISIAINTARAIGSSIATYPLPAGLPFVLLNAALGAVQLAAVAAKPIPKFFKGTDSAPDGLISVGERGRELIETKSGKRFMANNPTITSGLAGAKIYTNTETERIMRGSGYDSIDLREVVESNNRIEKAIRSQKQVTYNKDNRTITERKGQYFKTYLNAKVGSW